MNRIYLGSAEKVLCVKAGNREKFSRSLTPFFYYFICQCIALVLIVFGLFIALVQPLIVLKSWIYHSLNFIQQALLG